jgi:hypothetical protein
VRNCFSAENSTAFPTNRKKHESIRKSSPNLEFLGRKLCVFKYVNVTMKSHRYPEIPELISYSQNCMCKLKSVKVSDNIKDLYK